jgi:hypothetical protein
VTEAPEAEVGGQGIPAKARAHMVALEGLLSLLMIAVNLTFRCTGVHDVDVGARFQQVAKGDPQPDLGTMMRSKLFSASSMYGDT